MSKKEFGALKIIFLTGFLFSGLFKEYAALISTGLWGALLTVFMRRRSLKIYRNAESLAILVIAGSSLLTCFTGTDYGMGLTGFGRMAGVALFAVLVMQLNGEQQEEALILVPWCGAVMTLTGLVSWFIPPLKELFWVADRLGGFFQYPNVYGLFCLAGFILAAVKRENLKTGEFRALLFILLSGIFLSGSRAVFLLFLLSVVFLAVGWKGLRRILAVLLPAAVAAALVYAGITGNVQNVARFVTTSLFSSTLIGRIIYARDGLKLLIQHPFGLGYLGYYYQEPAVQTAQYSVRFIHNDLLQMALDYGIIPSLLAAAVFVKNIFSGKNPAGHRLVLLVAGLHFLVDFDLEFVSVWYFVLLLVDFRHGKQWEPGKNSRTRQYGAGAAVTGVLSAAAIYAGAALIPYYAGNPELTYRLVPFHTESGVQVLASLTDSQEAEKLAARLQKQNPYLREVWDVQAALAYQAGDYKAMTENKKKSLNLQRYSVEAYEKYLALLSQALSDAAGTGSQEDMELLIKAAAEIPELLKKTEETTDPLAYKTRDVPDFTLSDEALSYFSQITALIEE